METKVRNPHTNKMVTIGGKTYNNLIKEGYRRADLIDYTNDPKPIFTHQSSEEEDDEHEKLKKKFFKNPGVDPRNPNKRIYKNKKPFYKLVEEFGNPYKVEKVKKDNKKKDNKNKDNKNISQLLFTLTNYLSPEDLFSLYISNKDLKNQLNEQYLKTYKQPFIIWLRTYLKNQYEIQQEKLEKERISHNLTMKQQSLSKKRQAEIEKEIAKEQQEILRQRQREADERAEILKDEAKLRKTYEEQERARQFYQQPQGILQRLGIVTKANWRSWLLKNHPDKNNTDIELVQLVIQEGRRLGY